MNEDMDLVAAWQAGDAEAGERLIERHVELVHRFFSNKTHSGIDDLVQQTFLACIESKRNFAGRASFRSYLLGIARNVLFGHFRERGAAFDPLTSTAAGFAPGPTPAEEVAQAQEQADLLSALRTLPLQTQTLVELAYWETLSDQELAEVLEFPVGTIKSRLRRARQLLAEAMPGTQTAPREVPQPGAPSTLASWAAQVRDDDDRPPAKGNRR